MDTELDVVVIGPGKQGCPPRTTCADRDSSRRISSWCSTMAPGPGGRGSSAAVAHPADRQRCPRLPRMPFAETLGPRCRLRTARRRRPPLLRALRETIRVAGPPPGTRAGVVRSRRAARGGDAGRDVSDPRARQRHRHLGAAVRPLGARRRTIRGTSTAQHRDYRGAQEFEGRHVIVVGGGISAVQLLDEISCVTTTTWGRVASPGSGRSRSRPRSDARPSPSSRIGFDAVCRRARSSRSPAAGHARHPAARERGVLHRLPMFSEITETGVRWPTAPNDVPTSSCGARVFGRRSTISRRCGYAVPAEASR